MFDIIETTGFILGNAVAGIAPIDTYYVVAHFHSVAPLWFIKAVLCNQNSPYYTDLYSYTVCIIISSSIMSARSLYYTIRFAVDNRLLGSKRL